MPFHHRSMIDGWALVRRLVHSERINNPVLPRGLEPRGRSLGGIACSLLKARMLPSHRFRPVPSRLRLACCNYTILDQRRPSLFACTRSESNTHCRSTWFTATGTDHRRLMLVINSYLLGLRFASYSRRDSNPQQASFKPATSAIGSREHGAGARG